MPLPEPLLDALAHPDAAALLALAVGRPTPDRLGALLAAYARPGRHLLGVAGPGGLAGIIGLALTGPGKAVLTHIATSPGVRGQGVGRRLVEAAIEAFALAELAAETDGEAAGFYARLGFTVVPLAPPAAGAQRYACGWRRC